MFSGIPVSTLLGWANEARIWAGGIAAIAAVTTGVAGYAQIKLQSVVSAQKDAEQAAIRRASDERIAGAQEKAANANERAASLEREAAEARLEQERLKALVAWRELQPPTSSTLLAALAKSPQGVMIEYDASDTEAKALAIQIANLFDSAKWRIGMSAGTNAGAMSFGLFVPDGPEPATGAVRQAFRAAGLPFSTASPPPPGMSLGGGGDETFARLVVGNKPPPLRSVSH